MAPVFEATNGLECSKSSISVCVQLYRRFPASFRKDVRQLLLNRGNELFFYWCFLSFLVSFRNRSVPSVNRIQEEDTKIAEQVEGGERFLVDLVWGVPKYSAVHVSPRKWAFHHATEYFCFSKRSYSKEETPGKNRVQSFHINSLALPSSFPCRMLDQSTVEWLHESSFNKNVVYLSI